MQYPVRVGQRPEPAGLRPASPTAATGRNPSVESPRRAGSSRSGRCNLGGGGELLVEVRNSASSALAGPAGGPDELGFKGSSSAWICSRSPGAHLGDEVPWCGRCVSSPSLASTRSASRGTAPCWSRACRPCSLAGSAPRESISPLTIKPRSRSRRSTRCARNMPPAVSTLWSPVLAPQFPLDSTYHRGEIRPG